MFDRDELANVHWLEPWSPVDPSHAEPLARELRRELSGDHALFGRPAQAVARRCDCDDVLFVVGDPLQFAVVHLTYSRETSAEWPRTVFFTSFADFANERMMQDHEEYRSDKDLT